MKVLAASLLVTVFVTLSLAQQEEGATSEIKGINHEPGYRKEQGYYSRPSRPGYGHSTGYSGHAGGPSFGGRSSGPGYGGFGGRGSYRGRGGYGYGSPYGGYGGGDDHQLDEVDELYSRLETVQSEVKTIEEVVGSLEARLSLQKKILDKFLTETLPENKKANDNQDNALDRLEDQLDDITAQLDKLEDEIEAIEMINNNLLPDQESADKQLAEERHSDINQDGEIASLVAKAKDLKQKLLKVMDNAFLPPDASIGNANDVLDLLVKPTENTRMCEVGRVTLDKDDRKAEYLFQTDFAYVPFVLYSVCGFKFNMDAQDDYNSYGDYDKEPNRMGLLVAGLLVSKTGVTFELIDKSFGDTAAKTVDVCFQACSIGPQTTLIDPESLSDNTPSYGYGYGYGYGYAAGK